MSYGVLYPSWIPHEPTVDLPAIQVLLTVAFSFLEFRSGRGKMNILFASGNNTLSV